MTHCKDQSVVCESTPWCVSVKHYVGVKPVDEQKSSLFYWLNWLNETRHWLKATKLQMWCHVVFNIYIWDPADLHLFTWFSSLILHFVKIGIISSNKTRTWCFRVNPSAVILNMFVQVLFGCSVCISIDQRDNQDFQTSDLGEAVPGRQRVWIVLGQRA